MDQIIAYAIHHPTEGPRTIAAALHLSRFGATNNLTLDSTDAAEAAIDSRASTGGIPDPEFHGTTIAETTGRSQPALVVFSTRVFCVSRF